MWLYVFYDLPTETKKQRKAMADFRKFLLKDGFVMNQYSVYIRHCAGNESAMTHIKRVQCAVPEEGEVSILKVTDRQFSDTIVIIGKKHKPPPAPPMQLELF